ncbi:hypothetical protein TorRG33x02_144710, partial [Trema orientale]
MVFTRGKLSISLRSELLSGLRSRCGRIGLSNPRPSLGIKRGSLGVTRSDGSDQTL